MKNSKVYLTVIVIVLFIIYSIYYGWHSDKLLAEHGVYSITKIERVQSGAKGCGRLVDISFAYNNIKHFVDKICESSDSINQSFVGKRVFIKIVPKDLERIFAFNFRCSVPDSIKAAPPEG